MKYNTAAYALLANAIIAQTAEDYRNALAALELSGFSCRRKNSGCVISGLRLKEKQSFIGG